ncbi:hypothetical protein B0H16DRAFT_1836576 [Mycena metata]|uniref:Uncharacterized protein n=1 Tax=Mycena metata TaxID=1033252 RepID=A0AAD7GNE1_9AGAR|nr:hypothetical protein B0H16DRAFT_1836576 [Mycena metata]
MSSYWVNVLEPRLHPEDGHYRDQEPFLTAFAVPYRRSTASEMIKKLVRQVLESLFWLEITHNWVIYCLGLSLEISEAATLFVDVLWAECPQSATNGTGLELLRNAQNHAVSLRNQPDLAFIKKSVPGKIIMANGGDEEEDDDLADFDAHDPSYGLEEHSGKLSSMDIEIRDLRPPKIVLTSRNKSLWNADVGNINVLYFLIRSWKSRLDVLFGRIQKDELLPDPGTLIQEMNYLNHDNYSCPEFQRFFKESGLAKLFEAICSPKSLFQLDPNRSQSYYMFQWNKQLNLFRTRWTPRTFYTNIDWEKAPDYSKAPESGRSFQLLRRLSKEPTVVPRLTNPSSVFFLLSLKNFEYSWETWMLFGLKGLDTKVNRWNADAIHRWNPVFLFRELLNLTPANLTLDFRKHSPQEDLDPLLSYLILKSHAYRLWHKGFRKIAIRFASNEAPEPFLLPELYVELLKQPSEPTPPAVQLFRENATVKGRLHLDCPHCKGEVDYRQRCVWIFVGTPRQDIQQLHGCVISDVPESERLSPKGVHGIAAKKDFTWFTTKQLGLLRVYPRPSVFQRCKRDIVIFISADAKRQFGSVIYNAISSSVLAEMEKLNNMVVHDKVMKRSPSMMRWAYGDMTTIGTGMPIEEQMERMFDYAKTADTIVSLVKLVDPEAASAMCDTNIGLEPLGTTRCVLYCCQDYLSCCHLDPNGVSKNKMSPAQEEAAGTRISTCVSASLQYGKTCSPGEYEFVFTKYNIMVHTVPRCLWVFDSDEEHQVTLPSIKTVEAASSPVCSGVHATIPSRNASKALDLLKARRLYDVVSEYWGR